MTPMPDSCTPWPEEFVDRYWAAGHWRGTTLDSLLRGWALRFGPRTALVHGDNRITYAALNRRADRMAAGFRLRGLRRGQRVVVQLPNVPEIVTTVFALMRAGVVPVLCPVTHRAAELSHIVRVSQATGYVGPSTYRGFDHTAMAADIAAEGPFLRRVFPLEAPGAASPYGGFTTDPSGCHYFPLASLDSPPEQPLVQRADQVAFLLLADGAAGEPVLVPRTHNDYASQARAAAELVSLTEDDVYLAALPAASHFALGCPGILGTLSAGGTVVLAEDPGPDACLPVIERERVTVTSVLPAVAESWLDALREGEGEGEGGGGGEGEGGGEGGPGSASGPGPDLGSLRLVQIGGASLSRATAERVGPALGSGLQRVFAMAEGPLILTRPDDPAGTVLGTQGRPLSVDEEVRIVDADGKDLPEGEPGELLVRGPHTPRGYYRAPARDARAFTADGYFRTGRLARRTPDGDLLVTGRVADAPGVG